MINNHLKQGIQFMGTKKRHKTTNPNVQQVQHYEKKKYFSIGKEGFREGAAFDGFLEYSGQSLDFNGGTKRGENDMAKNFNSLDEAKNFIKNKNDFWGFEWIKQKTGNKGKAFYKSYMDGELPKNGGIDPGLKSSLTKAVYLKANNGMSESKLSKIGDGNAIEKAQARERRQMQLLENEFNNYMSQYKSAYKAYLDEIVQKQGASSSTLRNSIRKGPDGLHYYINGMGVMRKFDAGSWASRDRNSCPDPMGKPLENDEITSMTQGEGMGQGEKCVTGGYNVKGPNGEIAWVKDTGLAHIYNDYSDKHPTCPTSVTTVNQTHWDAIPKSNQKWTSNNDCSLLDLDTDKGDKAIALNEELIRVAGAMKKLIEDSSDDSAIVRREKTNDKKTLQTTLNDLKEKRLEIKELNKTIDTAKQQAKQQHNQISQIQLKYIAWALAGLTIGMMAIKQIRNA